MAAERTVAVVLAAGQGTRMRSELPKVLLPIAERPLVTWAVSAALAAEVDSCVVVVGHGRDAVEAELASRFGARVRTAHQLEQRGTGDAVRCALDAVPAETERVVILYGDCPLVAPASIRRLLDASAGAELALLVSRLASPEGYGRILRDAAGSVVGIREDKDCSSDERAITEVNPGFYAVALPFLRDAIGSLTSDNAQGELYLTDIVAHAAARGRVRDLPEDIETLRGVNDRFELALAEATLVRRRNEALMRAGVSMRFPESVFVSADSVVEPGASLGANVELRGRSKVASGAVIDTGSVLTDVEVHEGACVLPYSVATRSVIGARAQVGPFAHLREQTELGPESKVGNFTETKKTTLGRGSKVNHLSYVGDGQIGEDVNVGAGTIFCNYDGVNKHTTVLEDGVFIGSDSQLVAPVRVGRGAYVASGTTVTQDVPPDALALSRTKQQNKEGFASRLRAQRKAKKKR
jgi:bifunctional UDP-N-acetylglucosamine pyrophosphorylase / glucosamine-1-phosphate N-acetyltransferase